MSTARKPSMVKTLPVFSPIPPPKKEPAHNFHPIQEYDPDGRQDVLDGMALTLAEYVGAAGAASVTFGNEPRTSPGARSTSKSKVRFTPGTAGSDGGLLDGEGPVVPDSKALWRMPPPAAFSYDWKFDAPKRVIVRGGGRRRRCAVERRSVERARLRSASSGAREPVTYAPAQAST